VDVFAHTKRRNTSVFRPIAGPARCEERRRCRAEPPTAPPPPGGPRATVARRPPSHRRRGPGRAVPSSMAAGPDAYARAVARLAAASLAQSHGFELIQESALDTLADVLLRFLDEVGAGAAARAQHAGRGRVCLADAAPALLALGADPSSLARFASLAEESPFPAPLAPFPVQRGGRRGRAGAGAARRDAEARAGLWGDPPGGTWGEPTGAEPGPATAGPSGAAELAGAAADAGLGVMDGSVASPDGDPSAAVLAAAGGGRPLAPSAAALSEAAVAPRLGVPAPHWLPALPDAHARLATPVTAPGGSADAPMATGLGSSRGGAEAARSATARETAAATARNQIEASLAAVAAAKAGRSDDDGANRDPTAPPGGAWAEGGGWGEGDPGPLAGPGERGRAGLGGRAAAEAIFGGMGGNALASKGAGVCGGAMDVDMLGTVNDVAPGSGFAVVPRGPTSDPGRPLLSLLDPALASARRARLLHGRGADGRGRPTLQGAEAAGAEIFAAARCPRKAADAS